MIDLRRLREDPEAARASQRARGGPEDAVDGLLAADERRRRAVEVASGLRSEQKLASDAVRTADDKAAALVEARSLKARVETAEAEEREADLALRSAHLGFPNLIAPGVPPGGEDDYEVLFQPDAPTFGFAVRDHVDLGETLGVLDMDRATKVSGARFGFLIGAGAILELALVQLAMQKALAAGCVPVIPPSLVKPETMEGTGFLGSHSAEVYQLRQEDLYLVGTSEVPLAGYHAGEVLASLPRRYVGFSSCFRREAGSYGKDTRGIIRVHQFDKVEMFSFVDLEDAAEEHERLLATERALLDELEIRYRVIEVAAGDLGSSAARKYDCEAWLPSQERWMEVTSTSNCTDFQARRLAIRSRSSDGPPVVVATLNATLVAVGRIIVALLETHQKSDGTVVLPPSLIPGLAAYGIGNVLSAVS